MAENDNKMIFEITKHIRTDIAGTNQRIDKIEKHMTNLERRQTASTHFERSVLSHLADSIAWKPADAR